MRELKVCEFNGTLNEVQINFNRALDRTDCDQIFEVVEPFEMADTWHAGFCYWEEQRKLKAV